MRSTGNTVATVASPPRRPGAGGETASVGRVGKLALEYVRRGGRTAFGRTSCQTPWHILPPIYLDDSGSAYSLLVNPSGGLVGGDQLSIDLTVRPKAHAMVSTPSANRVYRSPVDEAVQIVNLRVEAGGILEWVPEHTIPFAGSRYRQSIDVRLGPGATLLLWDAVASGRIARGERWQFATLENEIRVTTASGASVREHYALTSSDKADGIGLAREWDYVGSLFLLGDAIEPALVASLETVLATILEDHAEDVLGGVSQPAAPGLVVKLMARSAPSMIHVLNEMWGAIRDALWRLPPASLRKY